MVWFNHYLLRELNHRVILLVLTMYCVFGVRSVESGDSEVYVMSENCGSVIDMGNRQLSTIRLRLTAEEVYRPHMSCSLVLRAPFQHRLIMVVDWLDIAEGRFSGACTDFLSAWNGELRNRTSYIEGLDTQVCGTEVPPSVTSQDRSVTLHFDSNTVEHGAGFSLLLTAFHHGQCSEEEFRCDNGRCIDKRLKCDDDDNCGDNSDTCMLSLSPAALALILITLIGCLIAVGVLIYRYRDRLFGQRKGADGDGIYQPTTESTTASTNPDPTGV